MSGILEKARQLNTEKTIKTNFEMLKRCFNLDNKIISRNTKIDIEQLEKIDNQIPVNFDIYVRLAEYFGIYTSDLFSECSLKEKINTKYFLG